MNTYTETMLWAAFLWAGMPVGAAVGIVIGLRKHRRRL